MTRRRPPGETLYVVLPSGEEARLRAMPGRAGNWEVDSTDRIGSATDLTGRAGLFGLVFARGRHPNKRAPRMQPTKWYYWHRATQSKVNGPFESMRAAVLSAHRANLP